MGLTNRLAALAALIMLCAPAWALELTMAAELGTEYTSNSLRSTDDEKGEWMVLPGLNFTAAEDTATLEMDVGYDFRRRMYTKDYWQDENVLTGDAAVEWHAIADRLDFFASNVRTESTEQSLEAATRANRQTVSTTEAGSRLLFQPRAADELQLEYVFRDIHTTRTPTDSQRHNGTARYLLGLSENRGLTLEGTYSDIEYEGDFPDAEYWIAMVGYQQSAGAVELELNAGYNWYERVGRGSRENPVYDGRLAWRVNNDVTVTLSGSHRITDQSSELREEDDAVEDTDLNAAFEETIARAEYRQTFGANELGLEAFWIEEDYAADVPRTNSRVGGGVTFLRSLTRSATLELYAEVANREYDDLDEDQDEVRAGFRVSHQIGRALDFEWGGRYETRDSQRGFDYDVWYADLLLTWTFLGARR